MKTHASEAKEETGKPPDCTGAKLEITKAERLNVKKQDSEFFGCAQYVITHKILEPTSCAGLRVTDRIRVGTPEDKEAQKKTTWQVSEGGPARWRRLLARAGSPVVGDDEEQLNDLIGRTVIAPIQNSGDFTNVKLYYRESDKDCPVIGLADAKGQPRRVKPAVEETEESADVEEPVEPVEAVDEEAEAPKPKPKLKPAPVEEETEEAPKPKPKPKKPPVEEEEE